MLIEQIDPAELKTQQIGPVTILFGYKNGKYPYGNSFVVAGSSQKMMVDPSLGVVARKGALPEVDMVFHSHVHEDHIAGTHLFKNVPWYVHSMDALGLKSIEGLMKIYGTPPGADYDNFKQEIETTYYYPKGGSVRSFVDGQVFDLGGVTVTVVHTPGHTRGHCCFLIEWGGSEDEKLVYLGDIELTGFGPYYGDAWSNLLDFEESIESLKKIEAGWWLTFHHKGLIENRETFLKMLDQFAFMIQDREQRLLIFVREPRSMEEIVRHRFVYRPDQTGFLVDEVERRSMGMHLERLMVAGRVCFNAGTYQATFK